MPRRPFVSERAFLTPGEIRVQVDGQRVSIEISGLSSPSFEGNLVFTFYKGSPLVHMEARISTSRPAIAMLYHCGLAVQDVGEKSLVY